MVRFYLFALTVIGAGYWMPARAQELPKPGELVITEIMANPEAVSDANGEWIEIYNPTAKSLQIHGLILKDAGSNRHVVTAPQGLIIKAGKCLILAKNQDSLTNGGVAADYQYANFTLGNTSDQVILCLPDETVIDELSYEAGWPLTAGASMELTARPASAASNNQPDSWKRAETVFGAGDKGSPGILNLTAGVPMTGKPITRLTVFPNPTQGNCRISADFDIPSGGWIRIVSMTGEAVWQESFPETLHLESELKLEGIAAGIWFIQVVTPRSGLIQRIVVLNPAG